jgi:hypothetical protein
MQRTNSARELEQMKYQKPEPTCGRIIHYYPVLPDVLKDMNPQYCKKLPAIVVEASDLHANVVVFSIGSEPAKSQYSVPHITVAPKNENGEPTMSYWKWPNER